MTEDEWREALARLTVLEEMRDEHRAVCADWEGCIFVDAEFLAEIDQLMAAVQQYNREHLSTQEKSIWT